MDPNTILSILQIVFSPVIKSAKWTSRQARRAYFFAITAKSVPSEITCLRIARSALGGTIVGTIPFRNLGSASQFLAVVRKENDRAFAPRLHVLEQVGLAYHQLWASDDIYGVFDLDNIRVIDLDKDGVKEVAFESSSFGSGAGEKSLYIYSIKQKRLFEVTEYYNYSNAAAPDVFPIKIDAGENEEFRQAIIKYASIRGFLQGNDPVDYDDPQFAILRWHKENGERRAGRVYAHLYDGQPIYGSSLIDELETDEIVWSAYFKGPLFAYIRSQNEHFIPYSPQWVYEWPKSLGHDGERLWFVCHCIPGLFSFEHGDNTLRHYCGYSGYPLPESDRITLFNGVIYFYIQNLFADAQEFLEIADLSALMQCQETCMLDEPHLPDQCINRRHREPLQV